MKHTYKRLYIILGFVFFMMVLTSCKHGEGEYHSVNYKIEAESKHYLGVSVSSEDYIGDIKTMQITEGEHLFLIPERKSHIKSYACTECHTKSLQEMQSHDVKKAHWDIDLDHANDNTMNCLTCHNANNMNDLISITGNTIDFNKSYQLCSQCHSKPFEDWKGGAHGKRIGGWAPPRVSMTCVDCHNPHGPHFESRWPLGYNTQKVKERE